MINFSSRQSAVFSVVAPKSDILNHRSFRELSPDDDDHRAALFFSKFVSTTAASGDEQHFIDHCLKLLLEELSETHCAFLACPGTFLYSKSRLEDEKFHTIRCFLENLSSFNMEAITPEVLASFPELNSATVNILRSPSAEHSSLVFIAVGGTETMAIPIWNLVEPWIRLRLKAFRDNSALQRFRGLLDGIHRGAGNMMNNLLNQTKLIPTLLKDAQQTLSAEGCALLLAKDEGFQEYFVLAEIGFGNSKPIPEAVFSRAMTEFSVNGNKPVVQQAGSNRQHRMAPLIQRRSTIGMLLVTGKHAEENDAQIAASILANLFSVAHESAALFHRFASGQTEWENTFDSIADPIYIIDNDFRLKKMNKSLASYSMKSIKVPLNPNCYRYLFNQNSVCPWCPVPKSMESGLPEIVEAPLFSTGVWQVHSFPYTDKEEKRVGSINVLRDITLLKRMQEQLIETEKLASAGKLISGVAHEVRNPLFGISATVRALANELKGAPQDIQPYIEIIMSETTRLNRLMEDLLNYTRPVKIDKNATDLAELVQEVIEHFRHLPEAHNAEFSVIAGDRIPPINMDRNKMKQVLINLFENGIQHAQQNPRVDIFLQFLSLADPPEIHLVVKDNGSGISSENLTRVFDPFFTTRQKGTGLGLSIVRKVIHDHGGRISVESHPGIGTTFRITLPVLGFHA